MENVRKGPTIAGDLPGLLGPAAIGLMIWAGPVLGPTVAGAAIGVVKIGGKGVIKAGRGIGRAGKHIGKKVGDLVVRPKRPSISDGSAKHIFRPKEGHLPDTPANRQLLIDTASKPANKIGTDKFGNEWFAATRADGSQLWVQVRNGQIRNAGLNQTPKPFHPDTGLSAPQPPKGGGS
jgi:hypothetical protein